MEVDWVQLHANWTEVGTVPVAGFPGLAPWPK